MEPYEAEPLPPGKVTLVPTPFGAALVTAHGEPRPGRPAILTFPDVGHDHSSCFGSLFSHPEMADVARGFFLIHLDPPGMEDGAPPYPPGYQYPSMEQLAELVPCVLEQLSITSIIGMGVGVGAFVLAKFALLHPEAVEGLVLINLDAKARGWMDWAASKLSSITSSTTELILSHLFSQEELSAPPPALLQVRDRLQGAANVGLLWAMWNSRGDLGLERSGAGALRCPVLLVVGDQAPYEDAVVECNAKLDPTQTSFLKMADGGGQPQLSQPAKLTEAFKYFVQGMGYMAASAMTRLSRSRTASLDPQRSRSRTLSRGSAGGEPLPPPAP